MLRVGLTGELGSGKSTVARLLASLGAHIFSSDETGRALMQPGEPVFQAIVDHFGPAILHADGSLNRTALASLAFNPEHPRVEELNALVHPAVLAEQERQLQTLAQADPKAIAIIESALLFTTKYGGDQPWRTRFDRILLVTAPDELKLARFVERSAAGQPLTPNQRQAIEADGRRRLAAQRIPPAVYPSCILVPNESGIEALQRRVNNAWKALKELQTGN